MSKDPAVVSNWVLGNFKPQEKDILFRDSFVKAENLLLDFINN